MPERQLLVSWIDVSILSACIYKAESAEGIIMEVDGEEINEESANCSKLWMCCSIRLNWNLKEENSFFISIKKLLILVISLVIILNVAKISFLKCWGSGTEWLLGLWIESSREEWTWVLFFATEAYDLGLGVKSQERYWKPVYRIGGGGGWWGGGWHFSLQSFISWVKLSQLWQVFCIRDDQNNCWFL